MKNKKRIQSLAKVIYGFAIVGLIFTILGVLGCAAGAVSVDEFYDSFMEIVNDPEYAEEMEGVDLSFIEDKDTIVGFCVIGIISCVVSIATLSCVINFYAFEIKVGEPFDKRVTKRMRKLAVAHIIIPILGSIALGLAASMLKLDVEVSEVGGVLTGIVYFIIARILDYGADVKEENNGPALDTLSPSRPTRENIRDGYYYSDYNRRGR